MLFHNMELRSRRHSAPDMCETASVCKLLIFLDAFFHRQNTFQKAGVNLNLFVLYY